MLSKKQNQNRDCILDMVQFQPHVCLNLTKLLWRCFCSETQRYSRSNSTEYCIYEAQSKIRLDDHRCFFKVTRWLKIHFYILIMTTEIRNKNILNFKRKFHVSCYHLSVYKLKKNTGKCTDKQTERFWTLIFVSRDCDYWVK